MIEIVFKILQLQAHLRFENESNILFPNRKVLCSKKMLNESF